MPAGLPEDSPARKESWTQLPASPSAASPLSGDAEKENVPIELNLAERTCAPPSWVEATPDASKKSRKVGTPVSLMLATPPPRSSGSGFRADAPAFVPGGGSGSCLETPPPLDAPRRPRTAGSGDSIAEKATPEKAELLACSSFVETRAQLLRLRCGLEGKASRADTLNVLKFGTAPRPKTSAGTESEGSDGDSATDAIDGAAGSLAEVADASAFLLQLVRGEEAQRDGAAEGAALLRQIQAQPDKGKELLQRLQHAGPGQAATTAPPALAVPAVEGDKGQGGKSQGGKGQGGKGLGGKGESRTRIRALANAARAGGLSEAASAALSPSKGSDTPTTASGGAGSSPASGLTTMTPSNGAGSADDNDEESAVGGERRRRRRGGGRGRGARPPAAAEGTVTVVAEGSSPSTTRRSRHGRGKPGAAPQPASECQ